MKITIIERLSLQAQRMQAMTDNLAKVFGPQTLLVDNLTREVAVTLSILDQVKAEVTTKVEEAAAAAEPDDYVLWRGMADLVGDPEPEDENSPQQQGFDSFPEE